MNIELYKGIMNVVLPIIGTAGMIALVVSLVIMLINILINAATGRGLKI